MDPLLSPAARALSSALFHFVWQGALIALGLAITLRVARASPAHVRYAAACLALGGMVAAPLVTFALSYWGGASEVSASAASLLEAPPGGAPEIAWVVAARPHSPVGVRMTAMLLCAWGVGASVMCARLLGGFLHVRRILGRDALTLPAAWQERARRLARSLGVLRPVRVTESRAVTAPTVVGWLRPVILLPAAVVTNLTPSVIDALIAHELAHVRRHDYLVNWLQSIVESLLFYHPCVWWVSHHIRAEREHCCDDAVVALLEDPIGYARALTAAESLRTETLLLGVASTGGSLMIRLRRLLDPRSAEASRAPRWGALLLGAAGLFALGAAPMAACGASPRADTDATEPRRAESASPAVGIAWLPASVKRWTPQFTEAAERHGVDAEMIAIITMVESNGDPDAVSPTGAVGLMQIMPATGLTIAKERGLDDYSVEKLRDPGYNIDFGAFYLAKQWQTFGAAGEPERSVELTAAAYNGGPDRVRSFLSDGTALSEETAHYKQRVSTLWLKRRDAALQP